MKAKFFLKTPPGGDEPVEYLELDPDDTGRNTVAHQATDDDKSRFAAEYEQFQKEQEKNGGAATGDVPTQIPVTVRAAAPLGREEEFTKQITEPAPAVTSPTTTVGTMQVNRMNVGEQPPEGGDAATADASTTNGDTGGSTNELQEMTVADAVPRIHATDDKATLRRWRREEQKGKQRQTILDAIDHRLSQL